MICNERVVLLGIYEYTSNIIHITIIMNYKYIVYK